MMRAQLEPETLNPEVRLRQCTPSGPGRGPLPWSAPHGGTCGRRPPPPPRGRCAPAAGAASPRPTRRAVRPSAVLVAPPRWPAPGRTLQPHVLPCFTNGPTHEQFSGCRAHLLHTSHVEISPSAPQLSALCSEPFLCCMQQSGGMSSASPWGRMPVCQRVAPAGPSASASASVPAIGILTPVPAVQLQLCGAGLACGTETCVCLRTTCRWQPQGWQCSCSYPRQIVCVCRNDDMDC